MAEPIIEIKNANFYQGENLILQDVNLTVNKGEFVYLVGRTGTGKSSLLPFSALKSDAIERVYLLKPVNDFGG